MDKQERVPEDSETAQKFLLNPSVSEFAPANPAVYNNVQQYPPVHQQNNFIMYHPDMMPAASYVMPHDGSYPHTAPPNTSIPPPNIPFEAAQHLSYPPPSYGFMIPAPHSQYGQPMMYYTGPPPMVRAPPQHFVSAASVTQELAREPIESVDMGRRTSGVSTSTADYNRNNASAARKQNGTNAPNTHLENCVINYNMYAGNAANNRNQKNMAGSHHPHHQQVPLVRPPYSMHAVPPQPQFQEDRRHRPAIRYQNPIDVHSHAGVYGGQMHRPRTPLINGVRYPNRGSRQSSCSDRNSVSNITVEDPPSGDFRLNELETHPAPPPMVYHNQCNQSYARVSPYQGAPLILPTHSGLNNPEQINYDNYCTDQSRSNTQVMVQSISEETKSPVVTFPEEIEAPTRSTSLYVTSHGACLVSGPDIQEVVPTVELQGCDQAYHENQVEIVESRTFNNDPMEQVVQLTHNQLAITDSESDGSQLLQEVPQDSLPMEVKEEANSNVETSFKISFDDSLTLSFGNFSSEDFKGLVHILEGESLSKKLVGEPKTLPVFDTSATGRQSSLGQFNFTNMDLPPRKSLKKTVEPIHKPTKGSVTMKSVSPTERSAKSVVQSIPVLVSSSNSQVKPSSSQPKPTGVMSMTPTITLPAKTLLPAQTKTVLPAVEGKVTQPKVSVSRVHEKNVVSTPAATQAAKLVSISSKNNAQTLTQKSVPVVQQTRESSPTTRKTVLVAASSTKVVPSVPSAVTQSTATKAAAASNPPVQQALPSAASGMFTKPVVKPLGMQVAKKQQKQVAAAAPAVSSSAWGKPKDWNASFNKPGKMIAIVSPLQSSADLEVASNSGEVIQDDKDLPQAFQMEKAKIGAFLKDYKLVHKSQKLTPRGLTNNNYWCYSNSVMQALLAIPQFFNLYKDLDDHVSSYCTEEILPVTYAIITFLKQINAMSNSTMSAPKNRRPGNNSQLPEVLQDDPFEATSIKNMLSKQKNLQFVNSQQDAEEFLSFILNTGHDELVECLKLNDAKTQGKKMPKTDAPARLPLSDADEEDEWHTQGPKKGKSCITRTMEVYPSPLSKVFWGENRSVVKKSGLITVNIEPFVTLPLFIEKDDIVSIPDAVKHLYAKADIGDYICPETKEEVKVTTEGSIDHLPEVLAVQLKRFGYGADGGQKNFKEIDVPVSLDLSKTAMSAEIRRKVSPDKLKYKLVSIVYHDGKAMTEGHYVSNVYHPGYNCWINYDDASVKALAAYELQHMTTHRVPYMVFYRREDTFKDGILPTQALGQVQRTKNVKGSSQERPSAEVTAKKTANLVKQEKIEKMNPESKSTNTNKRNEKGNRKMRKN